MKVYLVGGAVRDELLHLPVFERDWVVVGSTSNEMLNNGYQQVGKSFPVFLHPRTKEEYALARAEYKYGTGYTGFICNSSSSITLEDDLRRRDLTINAIARDDIGNFIDPYNGIKDIHKRILRHVSSSFCEDPLRLLRVARFAARFFYLGFSIAPETLLLMKNMISELKTISSERIWKETFLALKTKSPQIYFEVLRKCGALKIIFPEIDALFGVPSLDKLHLEIDTGLHTLMVVDMVSRLSQDVVVRFSALCHDIGKGITLRKFLPYHYHYGAIGVKVIESFCNRLKIPNEFRDLAKIIAKYHDNVHKIEYLTPEQLLNLLNSIDVWRKPKRLEQIIVVSESDIRGRVGFENYQYFQGNFLRQAYYITNMVHIDKVFIKKLKGVQIGKELYKKRLHALTVWKYMKLKK